MFSQFDDSEIAASDGPFDVVETYSDGIRFVAGRLFSSTATTGTTTATCSASSFLHLHHLTSFMEVSMLVDEVTRPRVLLSNQKQPIKSSFPSSLLSQLLQSVAVEWMGNLPVGQLIPLNSFVTRSTCIFFEDLFSLSSCLSFCFLLMMVSLVWLFGSSLIYFYFSTGPVLLLSQSISILSWKTDEESRRQNLCVAAESCGLRYSAGAA